ncbi:hypothetical protein KP509_32G015900 [Ceratopteris richardii]|nr:hypothetical protein KP509_32G015900 [Ceratopteris richardii]
MASHMMETFGQYVDGEIGNVFSMLARVQFEISKILDAHAAHVSEMLVDPTELMMSEIRQVQVMKMLYDEKRKKVNYLLQSMQKVNSISDKESSMNQLIIAEEDFNEQAQALGLKLKSIRHEQARGLIIQAAKYHSAQMHLFTKSLASITAIEPVMMQLSLEKNIDRSMSEEISNCLPVEDVDGASISNYATDNENSTTSQTTMTSEVSMASRMMINSQPVPVSSSIPQQKEFFHTYEPLKPAEISKYALPSLSNTGKVAGMSKQISDKRNCTLDTKHPLLSSGKLVTTLTNQSSITSEQTTSHKRGDERIIPSMEMRVNPEVKKAPKMNRSYSHSGAMFHKYSSGNRYQYDISSSMTGQSDPLYRSGPLDRSPMPRSYEQNVMSSDTSPHISELYKLPLPPTLGSSRSIAYSTPLARKSDGVPPSRSD